MTPTQHILALSLFLSFVAPAQGALPAADSLRLLHQLPQPARYFAVDKLQQVYLVAQDNTVYKYDPYGKELFVYNDNSRGQLAYIDATDPFNLLLFYPELQAVVALDRTLNETAVLHLFSAGVLNASAIARAVDNNIWVYDQAAFRLMKIGREHELLVSSDNLSAQLPTPPRAEQLIAQGNLLYLNCPGQGVFVFDNFTQFHQLLPYPDAQRIQLANGQLLLYEAEGVRFYKPETLQEGQMPKWGTEGAKQRYYYGKRYYELLQGGQVAVYSLKND